jgi:sortase A
MAYSVWAVKQTARAAESVAEYQKPKCALWSAPEDHGPWLTEMQWLRKLECLLLILGGLMVALYVAASIQRTVLSNAELRRFKARQRSLVLGPQRVAATGENPDFSLWSERRIKDYELSLGGHFAPAIAILRIPKIHVEVPVLEGTDDLSLNRGVGHLVGSAGPGENGNMAIAGHRDGFFRGLKNIALGDTIELATMSRTETYIIDRITIVDPGDVSVLRRQSRASLTLITCYPFYFVGSAPKRYIVQASVVDSVPANRTLRGIRTPNQEASSNTQAHDEPVLNGQS